MLKQPFVLKNTRGNPKVKAGRYIKHAAFNRKPLELFLTTTFLQQFNGFLVADPSNQSEVFRIETNDEPDREVVDAAEWLERKLGEYPEEKVVSEEESRAICKSNENAVS